MTNRIGPAPGGGAGAIAIAVSWVSALLVVAGAALLLAGPLDLAVHGFVAQDALVGITYPLLGASIIRRAAGNRVGWILVVAGLSGALGVFSEAFVAYSLDRGPLPVVGWVAWFGSWTWTFFFTLIPVLLLVFPDGRVVRRRWRPALWLAIGVCVAVPALLAAGTWGAPLETFADPDADPPAALVPVFAGLIGALALSLALGVAALFARWRSSTGVVRQQVKVFLVASAAGVVLLVASQLAIPGADVLGAVAFLPYPLGVTVAILRFHLYDIDRIVSRTVAWAVVTVVLVVVYAGAVFVLRDLLPLEGELAVAASTLAVAAIFDPLRRRVQSAVDRRFNRTRYDARRTVDAFGGRLRSSAQVEVVTGDLAGVAAQVMEPVSVSVWTPARRR